MGKVRADGYDECAVRVLYRYGGGMRLGERRWMDATIDGGVYEIYGRYGAKTGSQGKSGVDGDQPSTGTRDHGQPWTGSIHRRRRTEQPDRIHQLELLEDLS